MTSNWQLLILRSLGQRLQWSSLTSPCPINIWQTLGPGLINLYRIIGHDQNVTSDDYKLKGHGHSGYLCKVFLYLQCMVPIS